MNRSIVMLICLLLVSAGPATRPIGKIDLPLVGDMLGRNIKDVPRVVGWEKYEQFVQKTGTKPEANDLIIDHPGIVGIELTAPIGFVTKIVFYINKPVGDVNMARIEKMLAIDDPRVSVQKEAVQFRAGRPLLKITFKMNGIEAYIFDHKSAPDIAASLRKGEYLPGMSFEDQSLINDGPGVYEIKVGDKMDLRDLRAVEVNPNQIRVSSIDRVATYTVKASSRDEAYTSVQNKIDSRRDQIQSTTLISPK